MRSNPDDSNRQHIHDHHHTRHHKGHNTVGKKHRLRQILIGIIEALLFLLLTPESTNDRKTCQNLTRYKVHVIHKFLHQLKLRHCHRHKNHNIA